MTQASFLVRYPSLESDKLPDVLRLIRTLNVGPVTFFHLIQRFGTAGEALAAAESTDDNDKGRNDNEDDPARAHGFDPLVIGELRSLS